jgi:hypothetical protein
MGEQQHVDRMESNMTEDSSPSSSSSGCVDWVEDVALSPPLFFFSSVIFFLRELTSLSMMAAFLRSDLLLLILTMMMIARLSRVESCSRSFYMFFAISTRAEILMLAVP